MTRVPNYKRRISAAVCHFWQTRGSQLSSQSTRGRQDQGQRGSVTGGKQMDLFVDLVRSIVIRCGISASKVHTNTRLELPGYFRPEKKWDLIVVDGATLLVAIEFKSHVGPSFGNNYNNRSEEAIGSAQDIWTAFREGAFSAATRPWLGYLMLLEDCSKSTMPVAVKQPHFPVFPEFMNASYAERYRYLLSKLVRERLYDSACFLTSSFERGMKGAYSEPVAELGFRPFAASLIGHLTGYVQR